MVVASFQDNDQSSDPPRCTGEALSGTDASSGTVAAFPGAFTAAVNPPRRWSLGLGSIPGSVLHAPQSHGIRRGYECQGWHGGPARGAAKDRRASSL